MKDYIVTVEETYFDATKFEIGGFYFVIYKGEKEEEFKCILTAATKSNIYLKYYTKDYIRELTLSPSDLTSGKYEIKEVADVPMCNEMLGVFEFKDLYHNKCKIKTSKCYELKIAGYTYRGFCSKRNKDNITMVLFSGAAEIGVIYRDPTMIRSWEDNVKYIHFPGDMSVIENSITNGTVMTIDLNEIIEDSILFREMI